MKSLIKFHTHRYPVIILFVLILVFFGEKLIPQNGNFIGGIDVEWYFYWNSSFIKEQILSGSLPLWNPYIAGGMPIDINTTFYPSTLLYLLLPITWAFNAEIILHIFLAALGMYFFVTTLCGSKQAGLVSGIIYSLNGYIIGRIFAGHTIYVFSTALLPWIFYFIEKALQNRKPYILIASGMILGLQILTCDAQHSFYIAISLTIYYFCRIIFKPELKLKIFFRFALFFLIIPTLSFGISAIQLLPFWEFISLTTHGKLTFDACANLSFPINNFFSFLAPKAEVPFISKDIEFFCYIGVLPLFMAGVGIFSNIHQRYKWCMVILLLISITIILGNQTPIYKIYYNYFPLVASMRVPSRAIMIFIFSMSVLAGLGVHKIVTLGLSKKGYVTILSSISICIFALLAVSLAYNISLFSRSILVPLSFLVSSFFIFCSIRIKKKLLISIIVIIIIFIDLLLSNNSLIPTLNENKLLAKRNYEKIFESNSDYHRVLLFSKYPNRRSMKFHYFDATGYAPSYLKHYYQFVHQMAGVEMLPEFFRSSFNPKLFEIEKIFSSKILGIKYAIAKKGLQYGLFKAKEVLPRAILVSDAIFLPKAEDHFRYLTDPSFNPQKTILLLSSDRTLSITGSKNTALEENKNSVKIITYKSNYIKLQAQAKQACYLFLSETYYPGWHAYIDGKKAPILRANFLARAIPIPEGKHKIELTFRPISFLVGAGITIFTILLLIGLFSYFIFYKFDGHVKSQKAS
jgi:uncharacterized membrane protein YfhO